MSKCIDKLMNTFTKFEKNGYKSISDNVIDDERVIEFSNSEKEKAKMVIQYSGGLINRQVPVGFTITIGDKESFSYA